MSEKTWKLDPQSRYIVRRIEGKRDILFLWTPTLAQKKGFYPVSFDEAVKIKKAEDEYAIRKKAARLGYPAIDIPADNPVTTDVAQNKVPQFEQVKDEALKLVKTNEDLLKVEMGKIEQFQTADALEEYFLLKYRIELIGDQELGDMKKEAVKNLMALANANKLYEVK